jgi:hypothetical protein
MKVADLQKQQELFYNLINQVEKDYYLYFGLKSIQKKLEKTESIYDHFILSPESMFLQFNTDSDLPQEIKDIIIQRYQEVFGL